MNRSRTNESTFMKTLNEKMKTMTKVDVLDDETIKNNERIVALKVSTKCINLWMRQLEKKRNEMCELAEMLEFVGIKREIELEKSLERWAKRCTNSFTKNVKRMVFGEIDNVIWSGKEKEISRWCQRNRVYWLS